MSIYSTQIEEQEASDYIAETLEIEADKIADASQIEALPVFFYNGVAYLSWEQAVDAVQTFHPELGDDALGEYCENHISEV